jgi:predicted DNA-binding transcriptional regulator YafY
MRAGRLVALLIALQDGGRLTAAALARELEVSERTILRDIEALSSAGVPVFAVRGVGGGFQLLDGYDRELPLGTARRRRPVAEHRPLARMWLSPRGRRIAALTGRPAGLVVRVGRPRLPEGWVEAVAPIEVVEASALDVLALGNDVEVRAPSELRAAVAACARAVAERHARPVAG